MTELWQQGAGQLAAQIAARTLSPVDLMRATLARIDAVNPEVNAIVSLRDREALMGEARLAEAMPATGPLHGIPIAIKDLVAVKGVRSTWGSPILAENVPLADDGLARRIKAAGAIVIGKTNVPQFGLGSHSTNPVFGATRNPFDLGRTAGGSSGGAGAALATGMLSVADGSDMMGSLRNPAAWNDVYGFRPTAGLVPGEPRDSVFQNRLSTLGPMARNVEDCARLLTVLSDGAFTGIATAPRTPRIGWLGDWGGAFPMEANLLQDCTAAVARMADLGWQVEALPPPFAARDLWQSWTDLRSFAVAMDLGIHYRDPERRLLLNRQAIWEVERGLTHAGNQVERAAGLRRDWLAALDTLFARFDALVLPSTQIWPFPVEWDWPREIAGHAMDTYHRWMEVVVPASLAGLPTLAVPGGLGAVGLPFGLQLMGRRGADAQVLALGRQWQDLLGPRRVQN